MVRFNNTNNELSYTPAPGQTSTFLAVLNLPDTPLDTLPWLTPQVVPQAPDETAIKQLVASLHAAISSKDWEAMRILLETKFNRIAQASGVTSEDIFDTSVDVFNRITTSNTFVLTALDVSQLQIELIGTLNLVRVTRANKAPIHGQGTEFELEVPVFISRVGDAWKIVD